MKQEQNDPEIAENLLKLRKKRANQRVFVTVLLQALAFGLLAGVILANKRWIFVVPLFLVNILLTWMFYDAKQTQKAINRV